jgi:hypothetical protein
METRFYPIRAEVPARASRFFSPDWHPDGDRILMVSERGCKFDLYAIQLAD